MTTLNEVGLMNLQGEMNVLQSKILQLGQGLHSAIQNNNEQLMAFVGTCQSDIAALTEVLDSTIRLLFGTLTYEEDDELRKHINTFLSRPK